ncbi:MAG: (deoxy)nucleoside triphosphate pyrophosphohydrolase [Desulfobacterales bacterium]|nr:(deoxy)nucleoside triphosphate pyrophosphohydrolase [Desulfobacterales bacterium]
MIEVAAAFLVHQEQVLIARRKTPPRLAGKWEFPGGKVEEEETPPECLAREMEEEFGIQIEVGDFMADSAHHDTDHAFHIQAYLAYWISGQIVPSAHDRYAWTGPADLLAFDLLPADVELAKILIQKGFTADW